MAPISLKDKEITVLTDKLVYQLTKFKKSSRNFTLCSQFALSNFRYHKYLDVNSLAVKRQIEGVIQKLQVHSQYEKAETFQNLCDTFLDGPLIEASQETKTDNHYALILLLLVLSNQPTTNEYIPKEESIQTSDTDEFNWKEYLLGDAEEEILGIPTSGPCLDWSDDDLDSVEASASSESGIVLSSGDDVQSDTSNKDKTIYLEKGDCLCIEDCVVSQYWTDYSSSQHVNASFKQCSLAKTWQSYERSQNPFHQNISKKSITETQLVRETIWMLSGVQNSYVYQYSNKAIHVNNNLQLSHLTTKSLQSLLVKFSKSGEQSLELQQFKSSILEEQSCRTEPTIMTIQAFANSLSKYFKEYKVFLSKIEQEIIKKESTVTLLYLHERLDIKLKEIDSLHDVYKRGILESIEKPLPQRVTHLLDTFYISLVLADTLGASAHWKVSVLLSTFLDTLQPCIDFIDSWVTSGTFHDPANEFFINRDESTAFQSTLFVDRGKGGSKEKLHLLPCFLSSLLQQILLAGQSVNIIQSLGKMGESMVILTKGHSLYEEFLDTFLSSAERKKDDTTVDHTIDDTSLTPVMNKLAIDDIEDPMLKVSVKQHVDSTKPNSEHRLSKNAVGNSIALGHQQCMKPLNVLFSQSLFPLLQDKCSEACGSLMSLLKSDFNLMEHLSAVRNIFLLEAGSTMHQFYLDIFKKIRRRQSWQDVSYLNSHLQEALHPFFPQYIDRFTLSFSPNPLETRSSGIQGLHGLTMHYKVPWPVSLIIDDVCLAKYNQVFLFLLTVKQVKWMLDSLRFTDLSGATHVQVMSSDEEDDVITSLGSDRKPLNHKLMQKMYVLRFRLLHFVNCLHNYIMTRILHVTGLEFKGAFSKVGSLNDAIIEHYAYVERVFERCLLSEKVGIIKEAITKVFHIVNQFQAKWNAGAHELSEDAFDKIDAEFSKCNHFLITFLGNIVKRGSFPHLESLAYSLSSSHA